MKTITDRHESSARAEAQGAAFHAMRRLEPLWPWLTSDFIERFVSRLASVGARVGLWSEAGVSTVVIDSADRARHKSARAVYASHAVLRERYGRSLFEMDWGRTLREFGLLSSGDPLLALPWRCRSGELASPAEVGFIDVLDVTPERVVRTVRVLCDHDRQVAWPAAFVVPCESGLLSRWTMHFEAAEQSTEHQLEALVRAMRRGDDVPLCLPPPALSGVAPSLRLSPVLGRRLA